MVKPLIHITLSRLACMLICTAITHPMLSQPLQDTMPPSSYTDHLLTKQLEQKSNAIEFAIKNGLPIRKETNNSIMEILHIDARGNPQYLITSNAISAQSISTDEVYSGGSADLDLDGSGITVHQWDAGAVLPTHQEFDSRITNGDDVATSWHSTHVAGTIMASGVETAARGMAWSAFLKAFDWNEFHAEIAAEAAAGGLISNHSYGWLRGWEGGNTWWGDPEISDQEDYLFGFYDESAATWDSIVYASPYFLIVKSAGNDRDDKGDGTYPDDGPYDCIDQLGIAKNNLVVAAVYDIPGGYTQPSDVKMTGFSSWGPADDGRIKPDISANGTGLYSTDDDADDDYRNSSGTSMSTPSVAGSVALLQQHFENLHEPDTFMTAATVKALVIHTADETGSSPGPDYRFGWGLMNTRSAALKISENQDKPTILEATLSEGETFVLGIAGVDSTWIKATLAWTDPPGIPPAPSLDPSDTILVNDLDLRIIEFDTEASYYPWKLDKDNPSFAATRDSRNDVDNIEMVVVDTTGSDKTYSLVIDHDGMLQGGSQNFSLILTYEGDLIDAPVADFTANQTTPTLTDTVQLTDQSEHEPQKWSWSFSPDNVTFLNGTDSSWQHPQVKFDVAGNYNVSLTTWNAAGSSTETKLDFITAYELLDVTTAAFPDTLCAGDTCQLFSYPEGGTGEYSYSWSSDPEGFYSTDQHPFASPEENTLYFVEVSDGLQSSLDSVTVEVLPLPAITLVDWPEQLCNEDEPPIQLTALPEGGIFAGPHVSPDGIFYPEEADTGWNVISYSFEDDMGCIGLATDSIFVNDCVALPEAETADYLRIYPNPAKNIIYIESQSVMQEVALLDQFGKTVFIKYPGTSSARLDVDVEKGIYLLRIHLQENSKTRLKYRKVIIH